MNFQSLKGMMDSLVESYKCPECTSGINEKNVDIMGAAGNTINIDIVCNNCGKHSMVKTEILSLDLTKKGITQKNINEIKNALTTNGAIANKTIKDEEIVNLNKELKQKKLNVSDLLR